MPQFSRQRIFIGFLLFLSIGLAAWLWLHRPRHVDLAAYVPASALGYLEINDWPGVVDRLTATQAWRERAPVYGISDKLGYAGKAGGLAGWVGYGETSLLARAQFAVVVTAIEASGEQVKPHWALIAATRADAATLRAAVEARMQAFADRVYGGARREMQEEGGQSIEIYRPVSGGAERALYSTTLADEWIVANDVGALRACVEARLERGPSLTSNAHLSEARATVAGDGSVFGFVTAEGVGRLLKFGTYLLSGGALGKAALAGAVGEVFTGFSERSLDGIAYGASFENGQVVDRYITLCKPELVAALQKTVKPTGGEARALATIPAAAERATIIKVENPIKTLDGLEAAIGGRVGAAQSFILHQFVIGVRELFFGIKDANRAAQAVGDEIASFDLPNSSDDGETASERVWMVAARDPAAMMEIVRGALTAGGGQLVTENHAGVELTGSNIPARGAVCLLDGFLFVGKRARLKQAIDLLNSGGRLNAAPAFARASRPTTNTAAINGFSAVEDESRAMIETIARLTESSRPGAAPSGKPVPLPLAASATSIHARGLLTETHSPLGNFPMFISLFAGAAANGRGER